MKNKIKTGTIDFGIFQGYALVCIGGTPKEAVEKETDKGWKDYLNYLVEEGMTTNFCNKVQIGRTTYFSLFLENKRNEGWYAIVAHEIFHLCQFICKLNHIDMIQEKESVAHLHTHLMKQIIKLNN